MFFACHAGHGVLVPIADVAPEERAAVLVNAIYDDSPAIGTALSQADLGLGEGEEGVGGNTQDGEGGAEGGYLSVVPDEE